MSLTHLILNDMIKVKVTANTTLISTSYITDHLGTNQ